jgi:hypothetical protein
MAGWLVLTFAEDENGDQAQEKYKSAGETWLAVATPGYPTNFAFGETGGVVEAVFVPDDPEDEEGEGPTLKGKTRAELAAEAEQKAAAEAAAPAEEEAKVTAKAK